MPVTSIHFFSGDAGSLLQRLRQFGLLRMRLPEMPGVLFGKAMGCGQGLAFSLWPDWTRYSVMMECADEAAENQVICSPEFVSLRAATGICQSWRLTPFRKHGDWDGHDPFLLEADNGSRQLAVLTRATIPVSRVPEFVRQSRRATAALKAAPGLRFSIGMGELPLIRQATFSIWEDDAAMVAYAYKNAAHVEAMRQKAARRMFSEELFARFRIQPLPAARVI